MAPHAAPVRIIINLRLCKPIFVLAVTVPYTPGDCHGGRDRRRYHRDDDRDDDRSVYTPYNVQIFLYSMTCMC